MISAFARELAMKAVCLAGNGQTFRKHDLKQLYDDLPERSRLRVAADFPGIAAALDAGPQTFDSWRYFETAVAEVVAQALIDAGRARIRLSGRSIGSAAWRGMALFGGEYGAGRVGRDFLRGKLHGPDHEETYGVFDTGTWVGAFGAKRE